MLSRFANAIYWMQRYIERAENYARFVDVNFNLSLEMPPGIPQQWEPLVVTTGDWELFESLYQKNDRDSVIQFLSFSLENPNSIYSCLIKARENARTVRPEITREVWEQINQLYYFVKQGNEQKIWHDEDPRIFFTEVKNRCLLLYGILEATIARTDAWHFGNIGKLLERADKTSRILDVKYHILLPNATEVDSALDLIQWAALVKSTSAFDMYRKKYGKLSIPHIAEFLILDQDFPRAMLRSLVIAERSLNMVSDTSTANLSKTAKKLGLLKSSLIYTDIDEIIKQGMHEYLDEFQQKLNEITESMYEDFFSTSKTSTNMQNQKIIQ